MTMDMARSFENPAQPGVQPATISIEWMLYLALALFALVLRFAQLDAVPLSALEARQALAAWRVVSPDSGGTAIVAESPLLFGLHSLSFSVLGPSEFSARLFTAIAGVGLILSPLLFRDLLGRMRAFIFSLLLTFSPVVLAASRMDAPIVWAMLAAIIGLWSIWRYRESQKSGYAVAAMVCLAGVVLLTDSAGWVLALVLVASMVLTNRWDGRAESEYEIDNEVSPSAWWREWPWLTGLAIAALVVIVVSTQLMTYPAGLSSMGELLSAGARGLTIPRASAPALFPVLITLFYEPFMVGLALLALIWLSRIDQLSSIERFFAGWLLFGTVAGALYLGAGAEHALWLVIPLYGLVSRLAVKLIERHNAVMWWNVPWWAKWLLALATMALLVMLAVHGQSLARSLLGNPAAGGIQIASANAYNVIWLIIVGLFLVIGYFLASSIWGSATAVRGGLLGALIFGLLTGLGSGWYISVANADNPVEFWNRNPTSSETFLLRQTLLELADRQSAGIPGELNVAVLAPDDGVMAWLVRDFPRARFIVEAGAAKTEPIVLLPASFEQPDLGGSYVGQRFTAQSAWDFSSMTLWNFPAWWLQRRTLTGATASDEVVLWLRQDIYDGAPFTPVQ